MKDQACVMLLAVLCSAHAMLHPALQTSATMGGHAATTSGATAHVGPLSNMLAQSMALANYGRGYGYNNNQNADQSYLLPWLMTGGDNGRQFATMSMLMNSRGSNSNNILPFLLMGQDNMWPLMFANQGRGGGGRTGINPVMMFALGNELF